ARARKDQDLGAGLTARVDPARLIVPGLATVPSRRSRCASPSLPAYRAPPCGRMRRSPTLLLGPASGTQSARHRPYREARGVSHSSSVKRSPAQRTGPPLSLLDDDRGLGVEW